MYGSGMQLKETLRTRIQDLDFIRNTVMVRDAQGQKDRITVFPESIQNDMRSHLKRIEAQFRQDRADGCAVVCLPWAMAQKHPNTADPRGWQYVFPSDRKSKDPRTENLHRNHVYERSVNRVIDKAVTLAGIHKHVTSRVFRHSFATHLLESGVSIRVVQELLGHKSIKTTKIYLHCLNTPGETVVSPLDRLNE